MARLSSMVYLPYVLMMPNSIVCMNVCTVLCVCVWSIFFCFVLVVSASIAAHPFIDDASRGTKPNTNIQFDRAN